MKKWGRAGKPRRPFYVRKPLEAQGGVLTQNDDMPTRLLRYKTVHANITKTPQATKGRDTSEKSSKVLLSTSTSIFPPQLQR